MPFVLHDASQWEPWHFAAWLAGITAGMHVLTVLIPAAFESTSKKIEIRGKHLDVLEPIDRLCININRLITAVFVYHFISVLWKLESIVSTMCCILNQ